MIDLDPRNKKIEGINIHNGEWRYLKQILVILEQDVSEFSFLNDGDNVSAKNCHAWGEAILEALDKNTICQAKIPDKAYASGFREEPVLRGDPPIDCDDMNEKTQKWLRKFANFFVDSIGFSQW